MKIAVLTRTSSDDSGTFGSLSIWKFIFCSGELPWRSNKAMISCIPVGEYQCEWDFSPKFNRNVYHIRNVWGRTDILIHPANTMGDTSKGLFCELNGCIALGNIVGKINGQKGLLKSRDAVTSFESYLCGNPFLLRIVNDPKMQIV